MTLRAALALALLAPLTAIAQPVKVAIKDFNFTPHVITVPVGATVTWTNGDDELHTVAANDKSFHSPALDSGDSFSQTFAKPGVYPYYCTMHPQMTGQVVVKPSGG